jgi:ribonuclease HI
MRSTGKSPRGGDKTTGSTEQVTIFTDAQAAIRRMASDDPGPGQKYTILARRHIGTLRRARPDITIEIRWCPAHKGVSGNEKADEWVKLAAGAEWRGQQRKLWVEVRKETGRGKSRWKVRDLLADERCSRAVLDFLATTDVGRRVPAPAEEDAQSEVSEWELRERRERGEERRAEAEELGSEVEQPLFFPTPSFMASMEEECE